MFGNYIQLISWQCCSGTLYQIKVQNNRSTTKKKEVTRTRYSLVKGERIVCYVLITGLRNYASKRVLSFYYVISYVNWSMWALYTRILTFCKTKGNRQITIILFSEHFCDD